jgi:hypothetical protein
MSNRLFTRRGIAALVVVAVSLFTIAGQVHSAASASYLQN